MIHAGKLHWKIETYCCLSSFTKAIYHWRETFEAIFHRMQIHKKTFFSSSFFSKRSLNFFISFFCRCCSNPTKTVFCILLIKNRALKMFSRFGMSWQKSQVCLFQDGRPLKAFFEQMPFFIRVSTVSRFLVGRRLSCSFAKSEMKWPFWMLVHQTNAH